MGNYIYYKITKKDGKSYKNYYVVINGQYVPIDVKYFKTPQYIHDRAMLDAVAMPIAEPKFYDED